MVRNSRVAQAPRVPGTPAKANSEAPGGRAGSWPPPGVYSRCASGAGRGRGRVAGTAEHPATALALPRRCYFKATCISLLGRGRLYSLSIGKAPADPS